MAPNFDTEPCRWATAFHMQQAAIGSEPELVDLPPDVQVARGQELLRLLREPVRRPASPADRQQSFPKRCPDPAAPTITMTVKRTFIELVASPSQNVIRRVASEPVIANASSESQQVSQQEARNDAAHVSNSMLSDGACCRQQTAFECAGNNFSYMPWDDEKRWQQEVDDLLSDASTDDLLSDASTESSEPYDTIHLANGTNPAWNDMFAAMWSMPMMPSSHSVEADVSCKTMMQLPYCVASSAPLTPWEWQSPASLPAGSFPMPFACN